MNLKRVKAIGKLLVLFGIPIAVVCGIFGTGIVCGHEYRHGITSFERDWLGLDVDVAPAEDDDEATEKDNDKDNDPGEDQDKSSSKEDASKPEAPPKQGEEQPAQTGAEAPTQPAKPEGPAPTPAAPPVAVEPGPEAVPAPVEPAPEMVVDPLEGPLATRLATPVTVRIKVLVDDAIVAEHPDWIDYVQRTVSQASAVYAKQFGVTLELASVGRWSVAAEGLSAEDLLADVQGRTREGGDLVLGLTARPFDDRVSGQAYTPLEDDPFNGSAAVVYATDGKRNAHVRTLLHELGHLFGALDIADTRHPDFQSGSWMSYAPVPHGRAPWIDATNRARILARKDKPFQPRPMPDAAEPAPTDDAAEPAKGDAP